MSHLFLIGAGGFAREVEVVLKNDKDNILRLFEGYHFVSDDPEEWGDGFYRNRYAIGSMENVRHCFPGEKFYFPAVGSPKLKQQFVERAEKIFWNPVGPIIHRLSFIGDANIGVASIVCSFCSITTNVRIGKFVNVNLNCTIGHDVEIEDYVNLSPHCTISGHVHIKKGADLGSAVSVLPGVTIGENSIIGAGAVVVKDIPDNVVAVGIPAKVIKEI
jgi:sugar O-acyltransferase (sialic acid O-acetyltransferase NeuD family)